MWLSRHCVRVVNNFTSTCKRSKWLHRHAFFKNFKLHFLLVFYCFQSKIISRVSAYSLTTLTQCPRSCWIRWHCVRVVADHPGIVLGSRRLRWLYWHRVSIVVDYANTCFSQISSWKQKNLRNCFCLLIWGPGFVFDFKKISKISWHCPFK